MLNFNIYIFGSYALKAIIIYKKREPMNLCPPKSNSANLFTRNYNLYEKSIN